jgi:hypothetical protein
MSTLLSGSEAGPAWFLAGRGRSCRLLVGGLALDGAGYPRFAGKLAKVCVTERRKLRYPHRRPAGAERVKHGCDMLLLRLIGRRLGASQAPGCCRDGFLVLIHSANDTANGLRCHGLCDNVSDIRNPKPQRTDQ